MLPGAGQQIHALGLGWVCARPLHAMLRVVSQAVANDSSGSTVQLSSSMRQVLMDRVDAYGDHHTLRCLALASRPMAASNEPVGHPSLLSSARRRCVGLCPPLRQRQASACQQRCAVPLAGFCGGACSSMAASTPGEASGGMATSTAPGDLWTGTRTHPMMRAAQSVPGSVQGQATAGPPLQRDWAGA